ncbi:pentapeptide repeat-containing protein [Erwinia mallotivora]|uniref:pentapeptide repeat-containing protein n=1 Tax=Erwinia mallotivora TaxID=69222 RepID=UPI0035F06EED
MNFDEKNRFGSPWLPEVITREDLRDKDFSYYNYSEKFLGVQKRVLFSDCNLSGCDLTKTCLEGSSFSDCNLENAKLNINCANLSKANLNGAIINLNLPELWSEETIDRLLNNKNNSQSVLNTIESIDNEYIEIAKKLTIQLIESLEKSHININNENFPSCEFIPNKPQDAGRSI